MGSKKRLVDPSAKSFPFAAEFAPNIIDLDWLLKTLLESAGDYDALLSAIHSQYFTKYAAKQEDPQKRLSVQKTLAMNVLLGARSYGLLDEQWGLTSLARELVAESGARRYTRFAKHILENKYGLELLKIIGDLNTRGIKPTKKAIADQLDRAGFSRTTNSTAEAKLRHWLEKAGVVDKRFQINEALLRELLGVDTEAAEELSNLTEEQQQFLRAATKLTLDGQWVPATEARRYATSILGAVITEDQLYRRVVQPLVSACFLEHRVARGGRGGKSGEVRAAAELGLSDLERLLSKSQFKVSTSLRAALTRPLAAIVADLESPDKHEKGIALEALAIRLAQFLDLAPSKWRRRSSETGDAEVDLLVDGIHLVYSRWQIQCKNTSTVHVDDIAKEHGIAQLIRSNVIMMVTTGKFASSVTKYASSVIRETNLSVVLLDKTVLDRFAADGGALALIEEVRRQADHAMALKAHQVEVAPKASTDASDA
jgi:Restriction endonuclease